MLSIKKIYIGRTRQQEVNINHVNLPWVTVLISTVFGMLTLSEEQLVLAARVLNNVFTKVDFPRPEHPAKFM